MGSIAIRLAFILALIALVASAPAAGAKEKALCVVCVVNEGAREPEPVQSWRTWDGARYALCSDKCTKAFDAEPAAYMPPVFPRPAPKLDVVDLAGDSLTWRGLAGRVVLVDFWATWCAPCRKSMPDLQALHARYSDRGFTVVGVSIDEAKDLPKVRSFVASKAIGYRIALDAGAAPAWQRFGVKTVPAAYLIDGAGRIIAQWTGAAPGTAELEAKLVAALEVRD